MSDQIVTRSEFQERLAALCLDGQGTFPKKPRDRHILYRSILNTMDADKNYSASEINAALQDWLLTVGTNLRIDHVTLRRYLVDEKFLERDTKGTQYRVNLVGRGETKFADEVSAVDAVIVIEQAKLRAAERKQAHTQNKT